MASYHNEQEQALLDAIRKEFGCAPSECDVESAIDLAVDVDLLTISEVQDFPDRCHAYVQNLISSDTTQGESK